MRFSPYKKAIRCLGIAESFVKGRSKRSVLAGVVMRSDLVIDGVAMTYITVGGMDATDGVIRLYRQLGRSDVNLVMLNGCIIAWYNVIDLGRVHEELGLPLICVTYRETRGIEDLLAKFEDGPLRVEVYRRNGGRVPLRLKTGHTVYVRCYGIREREARVVLNRFTLFGSVPEPLRVAKLVARGALALSST